MHGPFTTARGLRKGSPKVERNLAGRNYLRRHLGNRPSHSDLIDVLERLPSGHGRRTAATYHHQRAARQMGRREAGERIRMSRTARDECYGGPSLDARVGVRCVCNAGLMPHVDDVHACVVKLREYLIQVVADERENSLNSKADDRARE
jgi:hypothetical protein